MPSRPPDTKFYEDEQNATLWRDVSRLYEDFLGSEEAQWGQLQLRFQRVLNDVLSMLGPVTVMKAPEEAKEKTV